MCRAKEGSEKAVNVAALILAQGKMPTTQSRQPLERVGTITAVERLVLVFKQAGVDRVVIVSDEGDDKIDKSISRFGVVCLHTNSRCTQMLDSVKTGLLYLQGKCESVLITPVHVPLFAIPTVKTLCNSSGKAVVPCYAGKAGHPLVLSSDLFPMILEYDGAGGLSAALDASGIARTYLDMDDEGVLIDIRKNQEYEHVVQQHDLRALRPEVKLTLAREQICFGPGLQQLLQLIEETESVQLACSRMGISYSRAWKMIGNVEQQMGFRVVQRSQGGHHGGKSVVTPKGRALMQQYKNFAEDCKKQIKLIFERYFQDW